MSCLKDKNAAFQSSSHSQELNMATLSTHVKNGDHDTNKNHNISQSANKNISKKSHNNNNDSDNKDNNNMNETNEIEEKHDDTMLDDINLDESVFKKESDYYKYSQDGKRPITSAKNIHHESQRLHLCLLHSINTLLGEKKYEKKDFDEICNALAPDATINPHKSIWGTGNYDANVLMVALAREGNNTQWYDARKVNKFAITPDFLGNNFVGFILNIPKVKLWVFHGRHWLTIKKIEGNWYNLDAKLDEPLMFKTDFALQTFLKNHLKKNDAQLMIVRKDVGTFNT